LPKPKCFCGCGDDVPRFPLFIRSANNVGRDITERLAYARAILGDQIRHPSFARWESDGAEHIETLSYAIHYHTDDDYRDLRNELPAPAVNQSELQRWLKTGRDMERGLIQMGAPSILVWLQMPEDMRQSDAIAQRLDEIRTTLAKAGHTTSPGD
jgi:hypothetical protein